MMLKFGIELEFFVYNKDNKLVPAYEATSNLDGNPVIGELRTGVYDNIVDCKFALDKLLYLESNRLQAKGYRMAIEPEIRVDNEFLKALRSDPKYINRKELEVLQELSIYGKQTGKILPRGIYKASLQVNLSCNATFNYLSYRKISVEDKYRWESESEAKQYSELFDYVSIIRKLDTAFASAIKNTHRVAGVYTIKNGTLGKRIEYRSLPNTVLLNSLVETLKDA
jgi:hypothetical protein